MRFNRSSIKPTTPVDLSPLLNLIMDVISWHGVDVSLVTLPHYAIDDVLTL